MRKIWIPIVGGLGNQLFCLAYAISLGKLGYKVELLPFVSHRHTRHHVQHFDLASNAGTLSGIPIASRSRSAALKGLILLGSFLQKLGFAKDGFLVESRSSTYDVSPPKPRAIVVRGYFQSPEVLRQVHSEIQVVPFANGNVPGSKVPCAEKVISIHYRRGDYTSHAGVFGLLADDYFLRAALQERKRVKINRILIFSDGDSSALESLLFSNGFEVSRFNDSGLTPAQVMNEIGERSLTLIASNSSFSWWAGAIESNLTVIYPSPWFRASACIDMGLPGWIRLDAQWN